MKHVQQHLLKTCCLNGFNHSKIQRTIQLNKLPERGTETGRETERGAGIERERRDIERDRGKRERRERGTEGERWRGRERGRERE